VIEDEGLLMEVAQELKRQLSSLPVVLYFKASFDKANRTSIEGFRGPGMVEGLKMMDRVRDKTGLRLCTDFHTPDQAKPVAEGIDFMQVPAFLCRQTDMIVAGAEAALARGRRLNVKKGQFLAPWDAKNIVQKVREVETRSGAKVDKNWFWLTERGVSFGYNTLVVDMISFQCMKGFGVPVIYDATHSVQTPGAGSGGKSTGGKPRLSHVPPWRRARTGSSWSAIPGHNSRRAMGRTHSISSTSAPSSSNSSTFEHSSIANPNSCPRRLQAGRLRNDDLIPISVLSEAARNLGYPKSSPEDPDPRLGCRRSDDRRSILLA
jgi:2-dehydro-3-deoxyphosphooctonate aldolase (KDO 8-P synthase)